VKVTLIVGFVVAVAYLAGRLKASLAENADLKAESSCSSASLRGTDAELCSR